MKSLNLDKSKKYLLACSFGPDSMALFYLLKKDGYNYDAAIVNYHLREESNLEVDGLLNYAATHGVKVHVLDNKDVPVRNIESKCREIRYKFFKRLSDEFGYDAILVAHHQDDLIETYILQKQRQITPIYYGIRPNTTIFGVEVIRPLLDFNKADLLEICQTNNVPYSIDKSNFDTAIKRNKIRHEIVSKLSDKDRKKILEEINNENAKLDLIISNLKMDNICDVDYLKTLDNLSLAYCLNYMIRKVDSEQSLSKENVGEIRKIIISSQPNIISRIKKNVLLLKEYNKLSFINPENDYFNFSFEVKEPTILDTPYFYLDFTGDTSNRNVHISDYPLTIRNAKKDDRIKIKDYYSTVRRLFIDWKMPISLRERWPLILNKNNEIIYIPRYSKDFKIAPGLNFFVKF